MAFERSGSACSCARRAARSAAQRCGRRRRRPRRSAPAGSPSATRKRTETPGPPRSPPAHELGEVTLDPGARELVGHPDLDVSVECERARGEENQAPKTIGERSSRMRSATLVQNVGCGWIERHGKRVLGAGGESINAGRTGRGERMPARPGLRGRSSLQRRRSLPDTPGDFHSAVHRARRAGCASPPRERDCANADATGRASCPTAFRMRDRRGASRPPLTRPADPTSSREAHPISPTGASAPRPAGFRKRMSTRGPSHPQAPRRRGRKHLSA